MALWRTVRVHDTCAVRIHRLRVLCRDADESRAHLRLHTRLDAANAGARAAAVLPVSVDRGRQAAQEFLDQNAAGTLTEALQSDQRS